MSDKRSDIFDNVKVERGSYVWRDGKFIPKRTAAPLGGHNIKRSDLPAPMIMSDIQEYRSIIDGSVISSRSTHRDHLRQHGCEEVGNEQLPMNAPHSAPAKGEIAREIRESIQKVEAGWVDPDLGPTHDSDGNPIEEPDLEPVVLPADIKNGDVIRVKTPDGDA